ncbi:SUN domain-containing protein 2-like [Salminus brasiliensis]|uniref:SUN domain-containing protein 2-like n=1 Tax=Salminus brasiliensis TaxID=930266 RepID=UPI003B837CCD
MRFEKQTAGVHDQLLKLKDNVSSLYIDTMKKHLRSQKQENEKLKAGLSSWLQKQLESASASQRSIVQHAELQGALKELERKLVDYLRTEMEKERPELWRNGKGILQREGVGGLTIQDVHYTVKRALHVFKADGVGMADYALESIGSTIIQSRCSDSYQRHYAVFSLFGIPIFYLPGKPSTIIQPEVLAGKCWAFKGDQGFTTISLAHPVRITHVTLDHLPKELSPTGHIYNAPKEFSVYGMKDELEQDGALLGTFVFDYDREAVQTFELPADVRGVYRVVQLRVESNWGHPEYTCIYRFRVHGQLGAPLTPDLQHHP